MIIETERLVLRPWKAADAECLYRYASNPHVGPRAGWPPHRSVGESAEIIRTVFARPGVFALTLKGNDEPIGCVGIVCGAESNFPEIGDDEGEVGYWLGVPFWGRGLMPEAVSAIVDYGFRAMGLRRLWCGYFDGNEQSRRVQEKCGFRPHHTSVSVPVPLLGEERTEHVCLLARTDWELLNQGIQ